MSIITPPRLRSIQDFRAAYPLTTGQLVSMARDQDEILGETWVWWLNASNRKVEPRYLQYLRAFYLIEKKTGEAFRYRTT